MWSDLVSKSNKHDDGKYVMIIIAMMMMMIASSATKSTMCGDGDHDTVFVVNWKMIMGKYIKKSLMREHLTYKCISSRRIFTFSTHTNPERRRVAPKKEMEILEPPRRLKEIYKRTKSSMEMCCIAHSSIFFVC